MNTEHRIIFDDSRFLDKIENNSIQLVVTSPPYWQLKDYDHEEQIGFNQSYPEYIKSLNHVWAECYRVLEPECRLCVNIGDQFTRTDLYGRYKIIPIREEIIRFCEAIGFDYMGAIIWQKVTTCNSSGGASVMGSFPYPRNGIMKLDYEFILTFKKLGKSTRKVDKEIKEQSKMSKEEWKEWFNGHWYFPGERQDEHIAMFPVELPRRLIKMFTFVGETVFDPFTGSGSTMAAALLTGRNSVGYEINRDLKNVIEGKFNSNIDIINAGGAKLYIEEDTSCEEAEIRIEKHFKENVDRIHGSINEIDNFFDGQKEKVIHDCLLKIRQKVMELTDKSLQQTFTEKTIDLVIDNLKIIKQNNTLEQKHKKQINKIIDKAIAALNLLKPEFFYIYENIKRVNDNYSDYKSVISKEDKKIKSNELTKVTEIIDVNHIRTAGGEVIRLGGIRAISGREQETLKYLNEYVLNEKIEIEIEYSFKDENTAYIKLKNKTHINAKLIKEGLADLDSSTVKKFSLRFSKYLEEAKDSKAGCWSNI